MKEKNNDWIILGIVAVVAIAGIIIMVSSNGAKTGSSYDASDAAGQAYNNTNTTYQCNNATQCGSPYPTNTYKCKGNTVQRMYMYPSCISHVCGWYSSWFSQSACSGSTPYCVSGKCVSMPSSKKVVN